MHLFSRRASDDTPRTHRLSVENREGILIGNQRPGPARRPSLPQRNGGWQLGEMDPGEQLEEYREHELVLKEKAALAGYSLSRFAGYYCGHGQPMTHYLALLVRGSAPGPS